MQLTEVQKKFICKNLVTTIELYYFTSFGTVSKTTFSLCEGTSHVISCRKLINCLIFIFLYSCLFVFFNLLNENECKLLTLAIKIYFKEKNPANLRIQKFCTYNYSSLNTIFRFRLGQKMQLYLWYPERRQIKTSFNL